MSARGMIDCRARLFERPEDALERHATVRYGETTEVLHASTIEQRPLTTQVLQKDTRVCLKKSGWHLIWHHWHYTPPYWLHLIGSQKWLAPYVAPCSQKWLAPYVGSETFKDLLPGTYNCHIVIDP